MDFYLRRSRYTITRVRHVERPSVRPSGLATGVLWTTLSVQRSLLASRVTYRNFPTSDDDNSRQNPQIRREIRKKIFRDKFFSDENLSVSVRIKKNTIDKNTKSLVARLSKLAHVTCLRQWESRKSTCDKMGQATHAQLKPPCFPVYVGRDGGPVAYHSNLKPSGSK